ncbi:MAG: hypothetical protein JXA95_08090, partial [Spirochaetales bacterium]|nr:hypothetical protein [Spirochaetales bacterium]
MTSIEICGKPIGRYLYAPGVLFLTLMMMNCNMGSGDLTPADAPSTSSKFLSIPENTLTDVSSMNGGVLYSMLTAQPSDKPESNSAPVTTYDSSYDSKPRASTAIGENTWVSGSISANGSQWFYFNATFGEKYNLYWDDGYSGSGLYNCDIIVSAFPEDRDIDRYYIYNEDSGYSTAQTITAAATERVYLCAMGYDTAESGTFALRVEAVSPNIVAPLNAASPPELSETLAGSSSEGQAAVDEAMREAENILLSSGFDQFEKYPAGVRASAASPISVGTTWKGVNIVLNGTTVDTTCQLISSNAYF